MSTDQRARELEELYRERFTGMQRALATVTGSHESAWDALQEAFARAMAKRRTFRGECPLGAWVWKIALRVALDGKRSNARFSELPLPDPALVEPERNPELTAALATLPPRRRLVVFLRYFAGCSYAEIAAICEISEGTVASALAAAKDELRLALFGEPSSTREKEEVT
jgi:RNA polymerase sigma-70 factor (ECF subfamily)